MSELCTLHQGRNEILDKYVVHFKKVWKFIHIKLDENKIYAIFFYESIMHVLHLHAPSTKDVSFSTLFHHLLQK